MSDVAQHAYIRRAGSVSRAETNRSYISAGMVLAPHNMA